MAASVPHLRRPAKSSLNPLPRLLTVFLVLLLAFSAAQLTWRVVSRWPVGRPASHPQTAPATPGAAGVKPTASVASEPLISLHLFGRPPVTSEKPTVPTAALPPTSLNISLLGVIFLSGSQKSMAIIAEKGNKASENVYALGDQLPGNAILTEIRPDRVVLQRGGRYETLILEEPSPPTAATANSDDASRTPTAAATGKRGSVTTQVKIERQRWEQQLADVAGLANEVGVEVYPVGSAQQGYKLKAKSDSKVLAELGLQPGDVLVEINGTPLQNASNALQAFGKLKNSESITLQILRDGRRQTKQYTIGL